MTLRQTTIARSFPYRSVKYLAILSPLSTVLLPILLCLQLHTHKARRTFKILSLFRPVIGPADSFLLAVPQLENRVFDFHLDIHHAELGLLGLYFFRWSAKNGSYVAEAETASIKSRHFSRAVNWINHI